MHRSDDVVAHSLDSSDDLYLAGCTRNRKSDPRRRLGSLLAEACGFMREDAWRLLDIVGVDLIKVVE